MYLLMLFNHRSCGSVGLGASWPTLQFQNALLLPFGRRVLGNHPSLVLAISLVEQGLAYVLS